MHKQKTLQVPQNCPARIADDKVK